MEPAGFEPAQAYFYAADLQSVELMPLLSGSTKHFGIAFSVTLLYPAQTFWYHGYFLRNCFVGRARFERARLLEPDLQSGGFNPLPTDPQNNRAFTNDYLFKCFVGRARFERATPFGNRIYSPAA